MNSGRLLAVFLVALIAAGCGPPAGEAAPAGPCGGGGEPRVCQLVIEMAAERLGLRRFLVTSTTFRSDMCPPNARCRFLVNEGWAIFTFAIGDAEMVHVEPQDRDGPLAALDGVFVASDPEPLPDWLIDEMARAAQDAS